MTALVLQARLDSSRLPSKALLPLGGEPLLSRVMEALTHVEADTRVLACPQDCARDFEPLAQRAGFRVVVGPKDDVLARYCVAVRVTGADRVIRATGDNPFVFADAASALAAEAESIGADYAAFAALPYGAGVEAVASEALLRAEREATLPAEREHVCPFLYTHPDFFLLHRPLAPREWRGGTMRVTVDTPDDYARAQVLCARLSARGESAPFSGERIIAAYRAAFEGVEA